MSNTADTAAQSVEGLIQESNVIKQIGHVEEIGSRKDIFEFANPPDSRIPLEKIIENFIKELIRMNLGQYKTLYFKLKNPELPDFSNRDCALSVMEGHNDVGYDVIYSQTISRAVRILTENLPNGKFTLEVETDKSQAEMKGLSDAPDKKFVIS